MKLLSVLPILVLAAAPVLAREAFRGFRCDNECPLAQQANTHRAYGTEAQITSTVIRADVATAVEANLARL